MTQNYKVEIRAFGRYPQGSILPRYVVEAAAGNADQATRDRVVKELVDGGKLKPTNKPVNVALAPPVARGAAAAPAPVEDLTNDLNAANKAIQELTIDRDQQKSRADLAESRHDAIRGEIAAYVEECGELRLSLEESQKRIETADKVNDELNANVKQLQADNAKLAADLDELMKAPPPKQAKKTQAA